MAALRVLIPLPEAMEWISDGDLLLYRRRGVIAAAGRGEYSHAALAGWWGDTLCCLEVRAGYGGRVVTLASQVRRYPGRIDVYQADPEHRWPHFDRAQTVQCMLQYAGENYGFGGLLRVAAYHLPILRLLVRPKTDDDAPALEAPFCSQACVTATRLGGGVDPVPQLADEVTEPADLARSPFYRYRATLLPDDAPLLEVGDRPRRKGWGLLGRLVGAVMLLVMLLGMAGSGERQALAQECGPGACSVAGGIASGMGQPAADRGPSGGSRQPEAFSQVTQAVARIENRLPGGAVICGSGVLVAKDQTWGWVLTCQHLFREGVGQVTVWLPQGAQLAAYQGRLLGQSAGDDLAVVGIAAPPNVPVPLAEAPPRAGEVVVLAGYGRSGVCRMVGAPVLGYVQTPSQPLAATLQVQASSREGDSGGPMLNRAGQVVGIIWGTDGYRTVGTFCGRIRQFLAGILGREAPGSSGGSSEAVPLPVAPVVPQTPRLPVVPEGQEASPAEDASLLARLQARLEELRQQVESRLGGDEALSQRLRQLEERTTLLGQLRERVEKAEQVVGAENLRAVIRQTAADLLAERGPGWLDAVLPAVLTALGWTGPPSLALVLAARLGLRLVERRLRRRVAEAIKEKTAPNGQQSAS